ncbi:YggT family protein [uncultured Cardiobacterium sp.]|uniref:YggT family protein n=1 Tax=uncultured Cardiobacterium sp. TaxID=417619 RepID=UPI00260ECD37|nr:YggT family protein [uncultured Cardiobacterium sp.]
MPQIILFISKLIIALFLIRFHANLYRLGFNPLAQQLNRYTDPLVLPFRRLLPPSRYDLGALAVAGIIALAISLIFTAAIHASFGVFIALCLVLIITTWLNTIFYAILIIVIGSWLQTDPRQPVMQIALACADWLLAPLRRIIPPVGMLDFTPMAALFILYLAQSGINRLLLGGISG